MSLISLFSILTLSLSTYAQVWQETGVWSDEKEKQYSAWVQKNWEKDFFSNKTTIDQLPNPFYGLRVDCADNIYSARIIFSYLHALPFKINDPTGGKKLVTNAMTRWNALTEKERIRRFLVYIYDLVSTKSIPKDTYPVAVSPTTIVPGAMILTVEKNHHSWIIKNIFSTGIPHLVFNSTVGAYSSLVLQERKTWPNGDWVFEGDVTPAGNAGVRYWRKESELKFPVWQVSGYSEEQYSIRPNKWKLDLQKKLQNSQESNQQKVDRLIENICADIQQRIDAVKESEMFLKSQNFQCLSEADFDTYSTPSRDRRLADEIIDLRTFIKQVVAEKNEISLDDKIWQQIRVIFPQIDRPIALESVNQKSVGIGGHSLCQSRYYSRSQDLEKSIDLAEIKRRLFSHRISSNPNDPPEIRFGEAPGTYRDNCPSWGNLKLTYVE